MRPSSIRSICVIASALVPALCLHASAQPQAAVPPAPTNVHPSLAAAPLAESIRLDGVLDEPAWTQAPVITNLTMSEPTPGATPTGRTVVRVGDW